MKISPTMTLFIETPVFKGRNNTFEYQAAEWARMQPVTAFVEHNFTLDSPVEGMHNF